MQIFCSTDSCLWGLIGYIQMIKFFQYATR